ncbi:hypothetical protein BKA80DRAFT_264125 [Phyllosticta citrichinensis]
MRTRASHTISGLISGSCASCQISSAREPGAIESSFCSLVMNAGRVLTQSGTSSPDTVSGSDEIATTTPSHTDSRLTSVSLSSPTATLACDGGGCCPGLPSSLPYWNSFPRCITFGRSATSVFL